MVHALARLLRPTVPAPAGPSLPGRHLAVRDVVVDGLAAVVLAGLLLGGVWLNAQLPELAEMPPSVWTYISGAVLCGVLTVRRVVPLTALAVGALAFGWFRLTNGIDAGAAVVALFLVLVTAGTHGRDRARDLVRGAAVLGLMGLVAWSLFRGGDLAATYPHVIALRAYGLSFNLFFFLAAWVLGDQLRLRREREVELSTSTAELATRTLELEAERQRTAEQATTAERLRLARELHDVLGHHVSVMGVQAAAARRILSRDPQRATEALSAIEGSSREAVTELQRVLALLRSDDDDEQATLRVEARLDALARELRTAGLSVTCQVKGLVALPTEIDLAVSRVVQESLTNALRHAGPGSSAWVRITGSDEAVEVEVTDDGKGRPLTGPTHEGTGSGLSGMRDRVELHGGRFRAGPTGPRGYRVHAWLPLPAVPDPAEPVHTAAEAR